MSCPRPTLSDSFDKAVDMMSLTFSQLWSRFTLYQPKQDPNCAILQLPMEMILLIFEQLPDFQRIFLAQSCTALRKVFRAGYRGRRHGWYPLLSHQLDVDQRWEFVSVLDCHRPDTYACRNCNRMHRMERYDVPTARAKSGSPGLLWVGRNTCPEADSNSRDYRYGSFGNYGVFYRHVQLGLKLTRLLDEKNSDRPVLRKKYEQHLSRLLKPVSTPFPGRQGYEDEINGVFHAYPKVVGGRFLMHCTWTIQKAARDVSSSDLEEICEHLRVWPFLPDSHQVADRHPMNWSALDRGLRDALLTASCSGEELFGSCSRCKTDFGVQFSPEKAAVRVWQDLGPEGTRTADESWERIRNFRAPGGFHLQPGNIRKVFERALSEGTPLEQSIAAAA